MDLRTKRILYIVVWLLVVLIGPFTIYLKTPQIPSDTTLLLNLLQRLTGLILFNLITFQIVLGAFMDKWIEKLGGLVFSFHLFEGATIYTLALLHPLLFVLFTYKAKGVIDPFFAFTQICVLCDGIWEHTVNFGRVAFWLLTVAVTAAKFRTHPLLQRHWRKFHVLNYVVFFFISLHTFFLGSDIKSQPFSWFYWLAIVAVSGTVLYRIYHKLIEPRLKSKSSPAVSPK